MTQEAQDDLSFVREMTEAGRDAPLLGGRFFVFYGAIIPVAYVGQWMVLDGRFGLPPVALGIIWITFGIVVGLAKPFLIASLKGKPGRGAVGNRVEATVWTTGGFAIFAAFIGCLFGTVVLDQPNLVWDSMIGVALIAYGIALYTTAEMSSTKWLKPFAVIAIVASGVIPALAGQPEVYLFAATIIIAVSLVPGVRLMANEPKSLPEEA